MKSLTTLFMFYAIATISYGQDTTYKAVIQQLFIIDELDQRYRNQIDYVESKYGKGSVEIKLLYKDMNHADSINLIQVEYIIEKYGWLGFKEIGSQANTTLFMVIQHSNITTWKKYLPIMKIAVAEGKAKGAHLALLQDRLDLHEGRKQRYGSQVIWSKANNQYFVLPIENPDNVDTRRADVGLPPLADYLSVWEMKWDLEQYKKDLPLIITEWKNIIHN